MHRFGINFHRNQRSRGTFVNELEMIKGIGKNTADTLLKKFKSVKKIKELSKEELAEVVGNAKAGIILAYFETVEKEAGQMQEESQDNRSDNLCTVHE